MKTINELLNELIIEEKASLIEGYCSWNTNEIKRLDIPAIYMTDGPHGLRKVKNANGGFEIAENVHSTSFPTSVAVASSWNIENAEKMGEAIGEECIEENVDLLLAPGVNIKRNPLCGRNFEYFSEDPLISGEFGSAFVKGVQKTGVGCTVKHFAANSNENFRFYGDSIVDERALREIYLSAFNKVINEAKPYAVMCSYNKLNGAFASQNKKLLTDILRDEWNYDGLLMTDWGATCERVAGVKAGCDLDMPGGVPYNKQRIIETAESGELSIQALDNAVKHVLELVLKCKETPKGKPYDKVKHAELSSEIACDSAVLLKNSGVLPLDKNKKILVVGELFEKMRFQGAGSSLITPNSIVSPKNAFDSRKISYTYQIGYRQFYPERNSALEKSAVEAAKDCDVILFFGGLTDFVESEGFDRENLDFSKNQRELINLLIATGKPVVLVLFTGSPVELPFYDGLSAILNMNLPGMHGGEATAALLFGEKNPSGKLAESWPMRLNDCSSADDYNKTEHAEYYESIYVGYRFYDKANTKLRFPFGFGLSYTEFEYSDICVENQNDIISVSANVKNVGKYYGAEVVELYVRNAESAVFKPEKELKAFTKVYLEPDEQKPVKLSFKKSDIAYWNVEQKRFVTENGAYEICLASSCDDIRLSAPLIINDCEDIPSPYSDNVTKAYTNPPVKKSEAFYDLLGYTPQPLPPKKPFTVESPISDLNNNFIGKILYKIITNVSSKGYKKALKMPDSPERDAMLKNTLFIYRMTPHNNLRSVYMTLGKTFTHDIAYGLVELANGHIIKALKLLSKNKK